MSRHFMTGCIVALYTLVGLTQGADAANQFLNVMALPLPNPHPACASAVNAIPNDGSSDWSAFNCAVNLLPASGGTIYVPAGAFNLHLTVEVIDRNVAFRGEGQNVTKLVWNTSGDGIRFMSTANGDPTSGVIGAVNYTLAIRSMSLIKYQTNGGAAIQGIWVRPTWHGVHGIVTTTITDVHIGSEPWPSASTYWHYGIQLQNSTTAKISMFNIQGSSSTGGVSAIQIRGDTDGAGKSIGTQIRNGTISKFVRGIETRDHAEGLHVQEVTIREAGWGIQMTSGQGTSIANSYISARNVGVELTNTTNVSITNNTIDHIEDQVFTGIDLKGSEFGSNSVRMMGNSVSSPYAPGTGPSRNGIVLDGGMSHAIVEGNTTMNMEIGVWLKNSNVIFSSVVGNINRNFTVGDVVDLGAANYVMHNH